MKSRTLLIATLIIGILAALGGIAYAFGTPQAPDSANTAAESAPAATITQPQVSEPEPAPEAGGMGDVPLPSPDAEAPPADPSSPFAIQIPGCVCHSDDPKVVKEHEQYRMNQCAGCHSGATPTGQ